MRTLLLGSNPLIAASILLAFGSVTAHAGDNSWAGSVTAVFQGVDDSGVDSEFTASADLFITLPMSNGEWLLYIEGSTSPNTDGVSAVYPTANADAGTVLDRDGNGRVQVSEFHYTFHKHDSGRFMVGLVNPSAWLDRSRITNDENTHFINANFKNNATIEFPDYAPGAVLRWLGSEAHPEVTVVLSSSHGIADLPDRSYPDLLDIFSGGRGAFVGADARWERKQTSLRLGSWVRTDDHPVADTPGDSEMNYGIYGVLGWGGAEDAVSVRVGLANDDVAAATHFAAVAYEHSTRIGLFGLGVASTRIADSSGQAKPDDVYSAEVFFRRPVGAGHITPSIQYVENPRFAMSDTRFSSSAVVAGVRFHWSF